MKCRYKAVLFDFDGTFADTGKGVFASVEHAVKAMGYPALSEKQLRTFVGPPLIDSFKENLGTDDDKTDEAVRLYRKFYSEKGIYEFDVYDGIIELVKDIRADGVKLAIASTKPAPFIKRLITYLELDEYFDYVSAPESEEHIEKSELISNALKAVGVDKKDAVMIGDRHFDILGAIGAGVDSIGVSYGYGGEEELKKSGAAHIAGSADEIRNIIFG